MVLSMKRNGIAASPVARLRRVSGFVPRALAALSIVPNLMIKRGGDCSFAYGFASFYASFPKRKRLASSGVLLWQQMFNSTLAEWPIMAAPFSISAVFRYLWDKAVESIWRNAWGLGVGTPAFLQ